ncbi:MAG: HAD family phosphatase [Planctomycetota bacterium]
MSDVGFVYFDLGNVLFSFDRRRACRNIAALFGGDADQADAILHESGLQNDLESGRISESQFGQHLHARYAIKDTVPLPKILNAISDMFSPIEVMADVIASLRAQRLPVGILSNTCRAHWDFVSAMPSQILDGPFDATVVSYQVGSMKPDSEIYRHANELAQAAASVSGADILFLDDRDENVAAARTHGWRAEQCLGGQPAIDALARHGITVDVTEKASPK